ncbi:MAG TPA: ROK family protein [Gemmatimonadales bacterium]|nr:ROK family protein [Gemmatimonadales bacterium]
MTVTPSLRIGIDFGGTKIEGIALTRAGEEIARRRVATPRDYGASLDAVAVLTKELERAAGGVGTVGVGIPGTVVPRTGLVKNANSTWLNGRPLGRDLEERLGRPVRLMNDANCFALSEATDGAAAGTPVVFGVILGTGVGGGIVVDGRCLPGANLIAGEWGHNPLPWLSPDEQPGPPCYCGKRGCVETWLSGPGFERDHAEHTGRALSSREIADAAARGDAEAAATLRRYQDRLGRALASLVNVLDPDVVVLGGGMSNLAGLPEAISALLPRYVFAAGARSDPIATRVVRAAHGDASGVRGAAWLWPADSSALA